MTNFLACVSVLLLLTGCNESPSKDPLCGYHDWAINEANDYRECYEAGTCKLSADEYATMRRRERACPWKFEGVER